MTFWCGSGSRSADPCLLTNGSGFGFRSGLGSGSCYFWHGPSRWQQKLIILKSKRSCKAVGIKVFFYYFCLVIEGSGSGSIPLTNGSGSGSRSPKNIWIWRIWILNTASSSTKKILLYLKAELELCWILAGVQVASVADPWHFGSGSGSTDPCLWLMDPDLDSNLDPDPAIFGQCCGSGSGIRDPVPFWPLDPEWVYFGSPISDTGSRIPNSYFWKLSDNFLGKKFHNSLKFGRNFFLEQFKNKIILHFVKFVVTKIVWKIYFFTLSFVAVFGSGIRDPGFGFRDSGSGMGKNQDPGSRINIPDPQHCCSSRWQ